MFWKHFFQSRSVTDSVTVPVETFSRVLDSTHSRVETYVAPVRKSIIRRYPTVFALLVTTGVAATFLGLEQILLKSQLLESNPELIFLLGIGILVFTGRLYKKLS